MKPGEASRLRLAAFLAAACLPIAGPAIAVDVDLELVMAVDVSASVDEEEAALQRQGYVAALTHPQVIEAIRNGPLGRIAVTYVEWAGVSHQVTVLDWTVIEGEASARGFSAALAEAPLSAEVWTSISAMIDLAAALLDHNGFEGTRRVIDISGDGYNNRGRMEIVARDEAVARGITINGLPIVNERANRWGGLPPKDLDKYYEANVIGGPGAFMIVAQGYESFADAILKKLVREIAASPPAAPALH